MRSLSPADSVKSTFRAFAASDPVALLNLYAIDEIDFVQTIEQLLRIRGDFQHPLGFDLANDLAAALFAFAADDFLVRQTDFAGRCTS